MSERIRCFIAFDLEDQRVIRKISEIQEELKREVSNIRIVDPKNIHITIRFLGQIPAYMVEEVSNILKKVHFKPLEIEFSGVGAFPNPRRPSVIWVGIKRGADELRSIFEQLESELRKMGLKPETRGFSPHVTIARVRSFGGRRRLTGKIMEMKDLELGIIKVESLRLKRSVLTPKGPIYSTLHEAHARLDSP